jgi:hypothetical protein
MTSQSRIDANRANAQLSTGPRTPEGKAISSRNAVRHGLDSARLLVRPDEREEFESFLSDLRAEIKPQGPLEETSFSLLLHAAWNLRRVHLMEAALSSCPTDPFQTPTCYATLHRLQAYHTRYERAYAAALRQLEKLQTNRVLREREITGVNESPETIPACASMRTLNQRTHRKPVTRPADPPQPAAPPVPAPSILQNDLS